MSTSTATSTGDPSPACQSVFGKGVWFKYTPSGSGPITVSTCGSSFDTVVAVYTGTCGALTPVTCDDDNGPACSGVQASVSFSAAAGTQYLILAGGYNSAGGILQISACPANDQCSGAIALPECATYTMGTADATAIGDSSPACQSVFGKGVWFTFTPSTSRTVMLSTCGSSFDTVMAVYTGTCGALTPVTCDDDNGPACSGIQASVSFSATAGTVYHILVGGYNSASGTLVMTTQAEPVAPPSLTGGTILPNGAFYFSFTNDPCLTFSVWTATNVALPLTNWTILGAPTYNGFGLYQFTDSTATNRGQRFYRVTSP